MGSALSLRGQSVARSRSATLNWARPEPPTLASTPTAPAGIPREFRRRFAEDAGSHQVAERFDDAAAALYYAALDPPVLADQERSIQRLLARRRQTFATPRVTAYEMHDPRFGRWTMTLLAYGEYGDFKLVNGSYLRLNNPPVTIPPRIVDIHVCWGVRFEGAPTASALHGVTALLVDDWRAALRAVPVKFQLHRLGPLPRSVDVGRGGRRWRNQALERLPNSKAVGALFERANRTRAVTPFEVASNGSGDLAASWPERHWWCACLLEPDLEVMGFKRAAGSAILSTDPGWVAHKSPLPVQIDHVFLIPPMEGPGHFYKVSRSAAGYVSLQVVPSRRWGLKDLDDQSWRRLRVCALDIVLDELSARLR